MTDEAIVGQDLTLPEPDKLFEVSRECMSRRYAPKHLSPPILNFYDRLVKLFGTGTLVSYQAIKRGLPEYNMTHFHHYLSRLWVKGWLDKYAKGEWIGSRHDKRAGRWWGVHYYIRGKNEIQR